MYFVYVIKSSTGKHYTGHTNNINRRLLEHNSGLCKTTKSCSNWKVIRLEKYSTRSDAMKREKWLKSGVGRKFLKQLKPGWSPPSAE